tara:strand:+ start:1626 stop:2201 length:576 start_codon:yes stop_codon:yes gene_type:complete
MKQSLYKFALCAVSISLLSACSGGIAKTLGIKGQSSPDEFKIVKHAPLEIPATLDLPKPQPGMQRPQEVSPQENVQRTLFGNNQTSQTSPVSEAANTNMNASSTDRSLDESFMRKLGATQTDANIRQKLDEEYGTVGQHQVPVVKKIIHFPNNSENPVSSVVNAPKEAERLQSQIEKGAPLNEGDVPSLLK